MQITISLSVALLTLAVHASPNVKRADQNKDTISLSDDSSSRFGSSKTVGATYFMTNEPSGNYVVASSVHSDGQLSLHSAVYTGGKGGHGNQTMLGGDGLFSQGSVKVSSTNHMLAVVNAGSNSLSLFGINSNDPTQITRVGKPADTAGEFPVSVAFNKKGDMACVLNGGKKSGVQCYSVSKSGLKAIKNTQRDLMLNQTTPPSGPPGTASHIIFTEDDKQVIASVKGVPPTPGMLAVWDVANDKSLSKTFKSVAPPQGGVLPFSMTIIPGKNAILATDPAIGYELYQMASGSLKGVGSAASVPGQGAICWSQYSKQTGNLYIVDAGKSQVTEVNVTDQLKSSVISQYNVTANSGTIDSEIASINGKDSMYILAANATSVDVLALNAPGKAKIAQQLEFGKAAKRAGLKVDPNNVQGMSVYIKH